MCSARATHSPADSCTGISRAGRSSDRRGWATPSVRSSSRATAAPTSCRRSKKSTHSFEREEVGRGPHNPLDDGAGARQVSGGTADEPRRRRAALLRRCVRHFRPRQRGGRRPGAPAGTRPPLLPGPQRAGDGAHGRRLREDAQSPSSARLHELHRPGRDEHDYRRRRRHHQSAARASAAGRHLRKPKTRAGASAARLPTHR